LGYYSRDHKYDSVSKREQLLRSLKKKKPVHAVLFFSSSLGDVSCRNVTGRDCCASMKFTSKEDVHDRSASAFQETFTRAQELQNK